MMMVVIGLVMVVEQPQNYWCFEWQQQYLGWVELLKMMVFGIAVGLVMVVEQPQKVVAVDALVVGFGFGFGFEMGMDIDMGIGNAV